MGLSKEQRDLNVTKQTHKCWICGYPSGALCRKKGHVWLCEVDNCGKRFNVNFGCFVHHYSKGYNKLAEIKFKELQGIQLSRAKYEEILSQSVTMMKVADNEREVPTQAGKERAAVIDKLPSQDAFQSLPSIDQPATRNALRSAGPLHQPATQVDRSYESPIIEASTLIRNSVTVARGKSSASKIHSVNLDRALPSPSNNHLLHLTASQQRSRSTGYTPDHEDSLHIGKAVQRTRLVEGVQRQASEHMAGKMKTAKTKIGSKSKARGAGIGSWSGTTP